MTLSWVLFGFFVQSFMVVILAMFVFASATVWGQRFILTNKQDKNLDFFLLALPSTSVFSALILIILYFISDGKYYYCHFFPIVSAIAYILYLKYLKLVCPKRKS